MPMILLRTICVVWCPGRRPDASDQHVDRTNDYIYNEVAIDYNAAFVGACAGLYRFFGDLSMQIDPSMPSHNVPVPPTPHLLIRKLYMEI